LDIDGVTGGFNFQSAWTTGWLAGRAMAKGIDKWNTNRSIFPSGFTAGPTRSPGPGIWWSTARLKYSLDCGLYQGHRQEALTKTRSFPADPKSISSVLLSHAHIDHSGGLPLLVKEGYTGVIHCTAPTADLLRIMLMDSAILQEEDAKFFNKIHAAEGLHIDPSL
jgi:ribonuclease BN (tRNA processing enzyme)